MAKAKKILPQSSGMEALTAIRGIYDTVSGEAYSKLHTHNLTRSQFGILEAIKIHGSLFQTDLAKHIHKTTGNITTVIDNLERDALVERVRGEKDRRYFTIVLTAKGRKLINRIYPLYVKQVDEVMGKLTMTQHKQLIGIYAKLNK